MSISNHQISIIFVLRGRGVQAYNFGDMGWKGRTRPDFLGWFWVRVHNFADVRPRSENGAKNQNLHLKRWSFESLIIRFVSKKTSNLKKEWGQNRMKNNRVMPIRRSLAKVAVGLFWPNVGYLATFFKISTSNLFCWSFTLILIGKPH